MHRAVPWVVLVSLCGGCSGGYLLTAADCLAPAGGQAPVVVRLQHRELPRVTPPAKAEALRFRVAQGPLRAAQTDKNGYASALVPVPQAAGVYPMAISLQDIEGEEAHWEVRTFVWDPGRPIVAVDLDALPRRGRGDAEARAALTGLAEKANLVYLTDDPIAKFPKLRQTLAWAELPEGPILPWRAEGWWQWQWRWPWQWQWQWRWRWQWPWRWQWQGDWWKNRTVVSPLEGLRQVFPTLQTGIAASPLAVQAFQQAGMKCLLIGTVRGAGEGVRSTSWAELTEKGLE